MAETVRIIVHPRDETARRLVGIGAGRLARLHPAAEQAVDEHPEAAARVERHVLTHDADVEQYIPGPPALLDLDGVIRFEAGDEHED